MKERVPRIAEKIVLYEKDQLFKFAIKGHWMLLKMMASSSQVS